MPILLFLALSAQVPGCGPGSARALAEAVALAEAAGPIATEGLLVTASAGEPGCAALLVARWTVTGWREARAAAPKGGSPESLAGAREALEHLRGIDAGPPGEYAVAALTAAMAAAQDERPEMRVYLEHARSIALRLEALDAGPVWPLPIDELEGELWLEVDRYREACAAYRRALPRTTGARTRRIREILSGEVCRPGAPKRHGDVFDAKADGPGTR